MKKLILIALIISACSKPATVTPTVTTPAVVTKQFVLNFKGTQGVSVWIDEDRKAVGSTPDFQYVAHMVKGDSIYVRCSSVMADYYTSVEILDETGIQFYYTKQKGMFYFYFKY